MSLPWECCQLMRHALSESSIPIIPVSRFREIGIRIEDGGTSYLVMEFCPWCAKQLPKSLRDAWFDEMEKRGLDPYGNDIPEEFLDERWYS